MLDQDGKLAALLAMTLDDQAALTFFDKAHKPRAMLGLTRLNEPMFSLDDSEGKPRVRLSTLDGVPSLGLFHPTAGLRAELIVTRNGVPELRLIDTHKTFTVSTRRRNSS